MSIRKSTLIAEQLFQLTLDFAVVKDASTHYFTHVNPAFVRALGYSEEELTSQPSVNFIHPDDLEETRCMAKTVKDLGSNHNFENRYLSREGRVIWLSWTAVYHPKENRVYAIARDITKIKERELEVAQQKMEIAAASKLNALGRLATGIAHEINNPLTIVYGQAFRLKKLAQENDVDHEELLKISEKIESMSSRIVTIINGLKAFSREGSSDPMELVSVKKIIESTLVFCRDNFKAQGIDLVTEDFPEAARVRARPVQISQVLLNLLNNAYDAVSGAAEKWIKISVSALGSQMEIRVSDSGPGVAAEAKKLLFEAFFTTKPAGKGTGLGLNIAKTLLSSQGGEIFLDESCPHTTFVVRLPLY
jgi:PAS domain S-box-containing protein